MGAGGGNRVTTRPPTCLEPDEVHELGHGGLSESGLRRVEDHLAGCAECREVVEEIAHTMVSAGPVDSAAFERETTHVRHRPAVVAGRALGRYLPLYPVLAAENKGLDSSARLVREAQAMARLSHPNVVHVYDIGFVDDHLFVAMELIEGTNLRQWTQGGRRSWAQGS